MFAIIVRHKVKAGRRNEVEAIWRAHMLPAVSSHPGHLFYAYCYGESDDEVCAFQVYGSADDAARFVGSREYDAYNREVGPMLERDPEVLTLSPRWVKNSLPAGEHLVPS